MCSIKEYAHEGEKSDEKTRDHVKDCTSKGCLVAGGADAYLDHRGLVFISPAFPNV